jgi:hypothetical protein
MHRNKGKYYSHNGFDVTIDKFDDLDINKKDKVLSILIYKNE